MQLMQYNAFCAILNKATPSKLIDINGFRRV